MENPIKMDDLGVPPFLETPNVASIQRRFFQEVSHRGTCVALDARKRAGGIREEKLGYLKVGYLYNPI